MFLDRYAEALLAGLPGLHLGFPFGIQPMGFDEDDLHRVEHVVDVLHLREDGVVIDVELGLGRVLADAEHLTVVAE